ncbi:MAG: dihydroorotase [Pseudomonadota bacterium]
MKTLFKNAQLIDPASDKAAPGHLLLEGGRILEAIWSGSPETQADETIECEGMCLAPGIIDLGVKVSEPGERHKESFRTAGQAAAAGGVTTMVTRPDTDPAIDTPETLEFVRRRANEAALVRVVPMAALTKGRAGREMVEIGFLKDAGAAAFTDCDRVVADTKVATRCLSYAKSLGAVVVGHPQDPGLSAGAAATSGAFASRLGLPSVSPMAESIGLDRDLGLIEITGAAYHFDQITTARSLAKLNDAKSSGLDVTAGISIHHLTLNEADIGDYRTFFKVKPPLRAEADRQAAVAAVASGLIDIVSSMHTPQSEEEKRRPFEEAASGAVGLETLLSAALGLYHGGELTLPSLFRALSLNPAKRLGLEAGHLGRGAPADLVLFDATASNTLDRWAMRSKSKNTPFDGTSLRGKVKGTWIGGKRVFEA